MSATDDQLCSRTRTLDPNLCEDRTSEPFAVDFGDATRCTVCGRPVSHFGGRPLEGADARTKREAVFDA
jgi:hypothetical protein